jgi:hypothetical protein
MANTMPASGVLNAAARPAAEPARMKRPAAAEASAQGVEQAGSHVHGRAFAAHRGAAEQRGQRQRHLADGHAQRQQALAKTFVLDFQRGNRLRNARAARGPECAFGQPGEQGERDRCDQERPEAVVRHHAVEHIERPVGRLRETDGSQADQHGTAPEQHASPPLHGRKQFRSGEAMEAARYRRRGLCVFVEFAHDEGSDLRVQRVS